MESRQMSMLGGERIRFVGIDEAGYGPNLGPLVVACVSFEAPARFQNLDWWSALAPVVGRTPASAIAVDDSKRLFATLAGRESVARTIHAVGHCLERCVGSFRDHFASFAPSSVEELEAEHWYGAGDDELRTCAAPTFADHLWALEVQLIRAEAVAVFPGRFNSLVERCGNKAAAEAEVVGGLIQRSLNGTPAPEGGVRVVVDRLGGRKFYREILEDVFADVFIQTREESPGRSEYAFEVDGRDVSTTFVVKADGEHFPVALASLVAKHLRELAMERFNAFWMRRVPGLRPTAGYPEDAALFRAAVEEARMELGVPLESFWRSR